jgi:hypothetical protein
MNSATYDHKQRGTLIPACLWASAIFAALVLHFASPEEDIPHLAWLVPALLLALGYAFLWLRVRVDNENVRVNWTLAVIAHKVLLVEISAAELCEHGFWYGYGIRWTPRGWLWNAQGSAGVRLHLRNGKCFHIGTDDAPALIAAVKAALAAHHPHRA